MPRVLLIEDDGAILGVLRRVLVAAGYAVEEAANGKEGLACYRQEPTDLVLTDIVMPDMEGLELIRALRRHDADAKIIAMSGGGAGAAGNYLDLAQRFGARWVLQKPFTVESVLAIVAEALASPSTSSG